MALNFCATDSLHFALQLHLVFHSPLVGMLALTSWRPSIVSRSKTPSWAVNSHHSFSLRCYRDGADVRRVCCRPFLANLHYLDAHCGTVPASVLIAQAADVNRCPDREAIFRHSWSIGTSGQIAATAKCTRTTGSDLETNWNFLRSPTL